MNLKFLLTISLVLALFTPKIHAQVTVDKSNFPIPAAGLYANIYFASNTSNYSKPTEGANQTWDYTGIAPRGRNILVYRKTENNSDFPESYNHASQINPFSSFRIRNTWHYAFDNKGYYGLGKHQHDTAYSLAGVTGNASDKIEFDDKIILYKGRVDYVPLPMKFGSKWEATRVLNSPAKLTIAAYGLNQTEGVQRSRRTVTQEVVGWGKLKMDDANGNPGEEMDVLLLKTTVLITDSIFLAGNPAPKALLDAFGVVQGQQTKQETYEFFRADFGEHLLEIDVDPDTKNVTELKYNPTGVPISTSMATAPSNSGFDLYPNPIVAGQMANFIFKNMQGGNYQLIIRSMDGKAVVNESFKINGEIMNISIPIPSMLGSGIYYYQLTDSGKRTLTNGKLSIIQ